MMHGTKPAEPPAGQAIGSTVDTVTCSPRGPIPPG